MKIKFLLQNLLNSLLLAVCFLLPWQTILIFFEPTLAGRKWQYGVLGLYVTELLVWLAAIIFIILRGYQLTVTSKDKPKFAITPDRVLVAALFVPVLFAGLSQMWAMSPSVAAQTSTRAFAALIFALLILVSPISTKQIQKWILLGAVPALLLGLFQGLNQSMFSSSALGLSALNASNPGTSIVASGVIGRWLRAYGPFSHPNIFGGYLVMILALTLTSATKLEKKYVKQRHALVGISIAIGAALVLTFSRSAWLSALILSISIALYPRLLTAKMKAWQPALLPLIAAIITFATAITLTLPITNVRLTGSSSNEIISITERLDQTQVSTEIFKLWPWFGAGAGGSSLAKFYLYPNSDPWTFEPPHNVLLVLITELGLFGLVITLGALLVLFGYLHAHSLLPKKRTNFIIISIILTALPLLMFDHYLLTSWTGMLMLGATLGYILKRLTVNK